MDECIFSLKPATMLKNKFSKSLQILLNTLAGQKPAIFSLLSKSAATGSTNKTRLQRKAKIVI